MRSTLWLGWLALSLGLLGCGGPETATSSGSGQPPSEASQPLTVAEGLASGVIEGEGFDSPDTNPGGGRLVLMVSLDTTRADSLSCYSDTDHWGTYLGQQLVDQGLTPIQIEAISKRFPRPSTPRICALADQGIRFQWALSHAPTTLSSHTSIFSGMDPHRHRVVRNGYPVPSDVPLIAERFSEAGWETLAVLGSSALESKMGLNRGFDRYIDPGPQPPGGMQFLAAPDVSQRVLEALDSRKDPNQDLFLFVHYFDPHMPWFDARAPQIFPPESFRSQLVDPDYRGTVDGSMASIGDLTRARLTGKLRFEDSRHARALYLSQVAWVDAEFGKLLDSLETRGLMEDALVVVTSDHGEALDDTHHEPYSHGPSVDMTALHVPLILSGTGSMSLTESSQTVARPVRLMDLAATVSAAAGLGTVWGDGRDLSALWSGEIFQDLPHMAEATRPMKLEAKDRWNNLPMAQAVIYGGIMLQKRPVAMEGEIRSVHQLYLLAPGQPEISMNEPSGAPSKAAANHFRTLLGLLSQWNSTAPAFRPAEYDAETKAALQALGYLETTP